MSGGYAGSYVGEIVVEYDPESRTTEIYIPNWVYLDGPGNPADTPPTTACTGVYAIDGYSDRVLLGTGDAGVVSYYDGSEFTPAVLGDDETIYGISSYSSDIPAVIALTGPHGRLYRGYLVAPYGQDFWHFDPEKDVTESDNIYDHFIFGNYHYFAGGSPARVYRQGGESGLDPTAEFPPEAGSVNSVYSLGHVGNLVLAGTGGEGILFGTRDYGTTWARAIRFGEGNAIATMLDMGSTYPLIVLAGVVGNQGGLYLFGAPAYAILESPALVIDAEDTHFGILSWDGESNGGGIWTQVRTFNEEDGSDAMIWDKFNEAGEFEFVVTPLKSGSVMEKDSNAVRRGDRFLQYRVALRSSVTGESPIFNEIRLSYGSLGYDSLLPEDHVHAVPNPVVGNECRISYALAADATVTAGVYDIKGRLVWSESEDGIGLRPEQFISWNTDGVAPGVYVYRVTANTSTGDTDTVVKKLAVLK
jgi:hypothetical protein